jgi:hypothetical protein
MRKLFWSFILLTAAASLSYAKTAEEEFGPDFDKEITEFYEKQKEFNESINVEQLGLIKQLETLRAGFSSSADENQRKNAQDQIKKIHEQILDLQEKTGQQAVDSAAFNVKVAQYRLKTAEERLAGLKERRANPPKFEMPPSVQKKK